MKLIFRMVYVIFFVFFTLCWVKRLFFSQQAHFSFFLLFFFTVFKNKNKFKKENFSRPVYLRYLPW